MTDDIAQSKTEYKKEPETRVKQNVYRTLGAKFREILRSSQNIQTDFKNSVQGRIKRQLKIAKKDLTDEELDDIARDPDKAKLLI
jgi:t-SNARE complex subunit (syntaxin)